jgi:lipopolysaccharide export system protein LptC
MSSQRVLSLLALAALLVGIVLLSGPGHEASTVVVTGPLHDPGYSAQKARLVQTGSDGQPMYTLDAAQIQQLPNNGLIELQQVQLGFRDSGGNQWSARAAPREIAQDSGVVRLDGDVHVFGLLPGTGDPATIISEHMAYDTRSEVVSTRDPVTLVMSGRELNATGLTARLKDRRLQLESAVHGTFRPQ